MTETAAVPVAEDEARQALAAALRRAEAAETELSELAGRLGAVIRAAVTAERKRIREPVESFLAQYGNSKIPMLRVGQDLADSILELLDDPDGEPSGA